MYDIAATTEQPARTEDRVLVPGGIQTDTDTQPGSEPAVVEPANTENWVEIVGPVMLQRRRGTEAIALEGRSTTRTSTRQLFVQVNEEHGESSGLRLVFPTRSAADEQLVQGLQDRKSVV